MIIWNWWSHGISTSSHPRGQTSLDCPRLSSLHPAVLLFPVPLFQGSHPSLHCPSLSRLNSRVFLHPGPPLPRRLPIPALPGHNSYISYFGSWTSFVSSVIHFFVTIRFVLNFVLHWVEFHRPFSNFNQAPWKYALLLIIRNPII